MGQTIDVYAGNVRTVTNIPALADAAKANPDDGRQAELAAADFEVLQRHAWHWAHIELVDDGRRGTLHQQFVEDLEPFLGSTIVSNLIQRRRSSMRPLSFGWLEQKEMANVLGGMEQVEIGQIDAVASVMSLMQRALQLGVDLFGILRTD